MADAHKAQHDYHLVDPSPWPIVGSISAFILAVGAITWMHKSFAAAPIVFAAGAIGVLYTMMSLWRDVMNEAEPIFAPSVALRIDPSAPAADDPYSDPQYQVPDDLVW